MRKFMLAWGISIAGFVCFTLFTAGFLPEGQLATHFDLAGRPNGTQSKSAYPIFFLTTAGMVNLLLWGLTRWMDLIPPALINIPGKDYWFSTPERKAEAFGRLRSVLGLSGAFVNGVFLFCQQMVYQENVAQPFFRVPVGSATILILILTVAFVFTVIRMTLPPEPN